MTAMTRTKTRTTPIVSRLVATTARAAIHTKAQRPSSTVSPVSPRQLQQPSPRPFPQQQPHLDRLLDLWLTRALERPLLLHQPLSGGGTGGTGRAGTRGDHRPERQQRQHPESHPHQPAHPAYKVHLLGILPKCPRSWMHVEEAVRRLAAAAQQPLAAVGVWHSQEQLGVYEQVLAPMYSAGGTGRGGGGGSTRASGGGSVARSPPTTTPQTTPAPALQQHQPSLLAARAARVRDQLVSALPPAESVPLLALGIPAMADVWAVQSAVGTTATTATAVTPATTPTTTTTATNSTTTTTTSSRRRGRAAHPAAVLLPLLPHEATQLRWSWDEPAASTPSTPSTPAHATTGTTTATPATPTTTPRAKTIVRSRVAASAAAPPPAERSKSSSSSSPRASPPPPSLPSPPRLPLTAWDRLALRMDRWLSFIVDRKVAEAGLAWDARARGYRMAVAVGVSGGAGGGSGNNSRWSRSRSRSTSQGGVASGHDGDDVEDEDEDEDEYDDHDSSALLLNTTTTTTTSIVCSPDEAQRLDGILQFWQRFYRKRQWQVASASSATLHHWIQQCEQREREQLEERQLEQHATTATTFPTTTPTIVLLVIPQKHLFTVERCLVEMHGWKGPA